MIFVFLTGTREVIEARLTSRVHHFMPPALLDSQLATLEPPDSDENVLEVKLGGTPDEEVAVVLHVLKGRIGSQPESVRGDQ